MMLDDSGLILKNEIKNVPYTSCMESTYQFTRYQSVILHYLKVRTSSKTFLVILENVTNQLVVDNNQKEIQEGKVYNCHYDEPSRDRYSTALLTYIRIVIWNDKRNFMVISNDSKRKDFGIKAEDEEEVEGVTGDEEVDVDVKYYESTLVYD
ncbi:hypothetical protein HZH68_016199 [Vespula germanica]|uniref:Uncharacterized protein n=1 Tax=Vespula germanica TaxID=30212 RepID=A0A834J1Y6_VESGE|nr:hypothetical protein HZH68_016199 [Vespula germanica]